MTQKTIEDLFKNGSRGKRMRNAIAKSAHGLKGGIGETAAFMSRIDRFIQRHETIDIRTPGKCSG